MWRVILSGLAIVLDVLLLLFMTVGVATDGGFGAEPSRARAVPAHATAQTDTTAVVIVFIAIVALNVLAILCGARAFPPRKPPSDVVSAFD